jgi:hypothetical protein
VLKNWTYGVLRGGFWRELEKISTICPKLQNDGYYLILGLFQDLLELL